MGQPACIFSHCGLLFNASTHAFTSFPVFPSHLLLFAYCTATKAVIGNTIQLSKAVLDCTDCMISQRNTSPVQQIQLHLLLSVVCLLEQVHSSSVVWVQRNISKYRDGSLACGHTNA